MTPDPLTELSDRVLAGDARAIARAITLVEDEAAGAHALVGRLHPHSGRAYIIGITGAPGAGKSTLADRLTAEIRRHDLTVGIIAVDPTSPFTGGAILGDRVRMSAHAADAGVFVRSMATRGQMGGLSRATGDAVLVLDAAGKDVVLIETVGVGQDEVDIVSAADATLVVLVPGTGDDVQALKAGIMEIADIFVVNKADREGADHVVQSVTATLALQTFAPDDWQPPIVKTEATAGKGIEELWATIGRFRQRGATRDARRRARHEARLRSIVAARFLKQMEQTVTPREIEGLVDRISRRELDPYSAADTIVMRTLANNLEPK